MSNNVLSAVSFKPVVNRTFIAAFLLTLAVISGTTVGQKSEEVFKRQRLEMVETAVIAAGIKDKRVIKSLQSTPRHEFVPKKYRKERSYIDGAVPIGESQTISSPFIVACMTEALDPKPSDRVLEIGTGSGYQAAVLSPLVKDVFSIEIVRPLGEQAAKVLKKLKYDNVYTKVGDGYKGWPKYAPFDKIIVTCSPEDIPKPLVDQLREGGQIVVPMGERHQQTLFLLTKKNGKMEREALRPTLFVPMTGAAEDGRRVLPDPANPEILNSDFEDGIDENGFVNGWYYQRRLTIQEDPLAPSGQAYVQFKNEVPGQLAHLMQGFAIDGRKVAKIKLYASFECENVIAGPHPADLPVIAVEFLDAERKSLANEGFGPFSGSRTWKNYSKEVSVPVAAREAIVRIGLFGATGKASFDSVSVKKVGK